MRLGQSFSALGNGIVYLVFTIAEAPLALCAGHRVSSSSMPGETLSQRRSNLRQASYRPFPTMASDWSHSPTKAMLQARSRRAVCAVRRHCRCSTECTGAALLLRLSAFTLTTGPSHFGFRLADRMRPAARSHGYL